MESTDLCFIYSLWRHIEDKLVV